MISELRNEFSSNNKNIFSEQLGFDMRCIYT